VLTSKLKKKVTIRLIIRNGARGTSVFMSIFLFLKPSILGERIIKIRLVKAPIQKPKIKENRPAPSPKNQPIPKINFPSPSPIKRPREKDHRRTNGKANIGPDNKLVQPGQINSGPTGRGLIKTKSREIIING
jgi:hypothetical protein